MAVINEQTLRVVNSQERAALHNLSRVVVGVLGNSVRKVAAWVDSAIEYIGNGVASLGAGHTRPKDRSDVRVLDPWLNDQRADRVHDHDGVRVNGRHSFDKLITVVPSRQVLTVGKSV